MRRHLKSFRRILILAVVASAAWAASEFQALAATWTNPVSGDFDVAGNWTGGVPNGAGAIADFSTVDLNGDVSVTLDSNKTLGQLLFGDTGLGTAGTWELRTNITTPIPVITLDNGASKPVIHVGPLTPTTFDDAFVGHSLAGTNGFNKTGAGILTLGPGTANTITGGININEGTLRLNAAVPAQAITIGNGATLETSVSLDGGAPNQINVAPGTTANLRISGGPSIRNVAANDATLNVHFVGATAPTLTFNGDWAVGGDAAVYNFSSDNGGILRLRPNGGAFNTATAFANSVVNMDNVSMWVRTNSGGNNVNIGALSGTSTAVLGGGGQGGGTTANYFVGSLNTDTEFAGTINSGSAAQPTPIGGLNLIKQGTGTLTLSGTIMNPPQVVGTSAATIPERRGGVTQIQNGRLRLTNSATITGGIIDATAGTVETTIDVQANGILDVTGYTAGTYSTQPIQQITGTGNIQGNWNHAAGTIRPGNVPTNFSHITTPVAGNITFNGNLDLSGGDIGFDTSQSVGSGNDHITVTGSVNITGGSIRPNFTNGVPPSTNVYTVLTAAGGITGDPNTMVVDNPGRSTDGVPFVSGNTLLFNVSGAVPAKSLTWLGTSATWDEEITTNWTDGSMNEKFFQFDSVTFDDSAGNQSVEIVGVVRPASVTVHTDTAYSFGVPTGMTGTITSPGAFTKTGTGDLTFTTGGQYSSASVENGTINAGGVAGPFGSGPLSLSNVTVVHNQGFVNSSITFSGTNTIDMAGTAVQNGAYGLSTMGGSGTLNFTTSIVDKWMQWGGSTGFTGTINIGVAGQAGNFQHLRLSGGGGGNNLSGVVLNILGATRITNRTGNGTLATFQIGEIHAPDPGALLEPFFGGTASDANWEIGALNGNSDFAGTIIDSGDFASHLTKVGTGTLTLTNFNTYTGMTSILDGILSITQPYLGDMSEVRIASGATFELNFVGTDTIGGLQIGGVPMAPGTYGVGALNPGGVFTGTGQLIVTETFVQPGDFDGDGDVDGRDFLVWQRGGSPSGPASAADLLEWRNWYGTTRPSSVPLITSVPEPGAMALAACGLALLALRKRG